MRTTILALAFAGLVAIPTGVAAAPIPAGGLTRAAATLDSTEVVRGRGHGHFRGHHAGRRHGFHRHHGFHRRHAFHRHHHWRHHRWRHHRVYRPVHWYGYRAGHFHCHRHFRWGYVIRHCHWHRHGHH